MSDSLRKKNFRQCKKSVEANDADIEEAIEYERKQQEKSSDAESTSGEEVVKIEDTEEGKEDAVSSEEASRQKKRNNLFI